MTIASDYELCNINLMSVEHTGCFYKAPAFHMELPRAL